MRPICCSLSQRGRLIMGPSYCVDETLIDETANCDHARPAGRAPQPPLEVSEERIVYCEEGSMSTSFLTAAERDRWQRFPETIPQDDLAVYFLLSEDDQREVNRQREPCNRLGYALQLCTLRYLGFVPTDFTATPEVAVTFVADQLGIAPRVLAQYDNRRTQSDHRRYVRAYLGFRTATPLDLYGSPIFAART